MYGEKSSMIVQRLPHACGGVSISIMFLASLIWSSPRMWGCFLFIWMLSNGRWVFPTHVWVFPYRAASHPTQKGLPHACGARNKAPFLTVGGFSSFLFPAAHIGPISFMMSAPRLPAAAATPARTDSPPARLFSAASSAAIRTSSAARRFP